MYYINYIDMIMKNVKDMTLEELEREQIRLEARRAELNLQMRVERFKKYPKELRAILRKLGCAPDDPDVIIHRTTGSFEIKK